MEKLAQFEQVENKENKGEIQKAPAPEKAPEVAAKQLKAEEKTDDVKKETKPTQTQPVQAKKVEVLTSKEKPKVDAKIDNKLEVKPDVQTKLFKKHELNPMFVQKNQNKDIAPTL